MENGKMTCFQVSLKISSYCNTQHLCCVLQSQLLFIQYFVKTITVIGEHKCRVLEYDEKFERNLKASHLTIFQIRDGLEGGYI